MSWLKKKLQWIKENVWLPLTATILLLLSILLVRKPSKQLLETFNKNRDLQNEEAKVVENNNEELDKKTAEVRKKTKEKIKKVKSIRLKQSKKQQEKLKKRIDELAKKSNEELSDLLKKADEV